VILKGLIHSKIRGSNDRRQSNRWARTLAVLLRKQDRFLSTWQVSSSRTGSFSLVGEALPSYVLVRKNSKLREFKMAPVATTKMSSKGQVGIPEEIRKRLGLK
jgi:hypothetical protein